MADGEGQSKSIDLTGLRKPKPAGEDAGQMSVPPGPQVPDGVARKGPPLPVGEALRATDPESLTNFEIGELQKIGWKEGDKIPSNMAEIVAAEKSAKDEARNDLPLPVDPGTPPVEMNPVPIDSLEPEKQAEVKRQMDEALARAAANEADRNQARQIAESPEVARKVIAAAAMQSSEAAEAPERPATSHVPNPDHVPGVGTAEAPTPPTEASLQVPTFCEHCGWDQTMQDVAEPDRKVKLKFVAALVGQKPYTTKVELLNGALSLTYRTLTSAESDACFKQAFRDRDQGEFLSQSDFWEKVNRYRLYLQLAYIEREGQEPLALPDGLSVETNPNATGYWEVPEDEKDRLKLVEEHILANILPSEMMARIAQVELQRFNRLVSKLEAMVDNADFWKAIEEPS